MEKLPCLPVKITDKQWADRLQDGSVFMRSLYEYGSWSAIERSKVGNDKMKSGIQGDIMEGLVRRVDPKVGDKFISLLPDDLRAVMKDAFYINKNFYQYCKIYCMYGLTYLPKEKKFEIPDKRLEEFGDTAVIIYNPNEFLNRILGSLHAQYGNNINFKIDEVHYYPTNYYGNLDEFCKAESFAWQNEIRMRIAILDKNTTMTDEKGRIKKQLIMDTEPIIVEIDDIRDISIQIPTKDLINLKLPSIIQPPNVEM